MACAIRPRSRTPVRGRIAALLATATFALCPTISLAATGCDDLSSIPMTWLIDYNNDIQNIFDTRCSNCHVDNPSPFADMDLSSGVSWDNIVNVPSSEQPGRFRIVPGDPLASVLFEKINCDNPDFGSRMPFGRSPLPLAEQALIYDWILLGSPSTTTDFIFSSGFEPTP